MRQAVEAFTQNQNWQSPSVILPF